MFLSRRFFSTGLAFLFLCLLIVVYLQEKSSSGSSLTTWPHDRSDTLGIAAQIFVISLPRRTDRREQMETLRRALSLRWTYIDAIDSSDDKVGRILDRVRAQRADPGTNGHLIQPDPSFRWPDDIDSLAASDEPLRHSGSDFWATTIRDVSFSDSMNYSHGLNSSSAQDRSPAPLLCATEDDNVMPYVPGLPEYRILSAAKIACWYSHWSIIHRVANDKNKLDVTVILEDDVDMELDIRERLGSIWGLLPKTWDIVFLGHCWSNESHHAPLQSDGGLSTLGANNSQLHPSSAPKCTHAYALSRTGARRLWLHLRHSPFTYSRALDQAYAWLIAGKRLHSYSVVPSVVVQQKSGWSDVMTGNGSGWRETLVNGVLGS